MAVELEIMHTACCTLARYHRQNGRRLVAVAALEAGEAPVDKLDGVLGLDSDNGGAAILVYNVTTEHEARSHMYLPWRGSHLTIMGAGSKTALEVSVTESCSW
jgi:hypothetical protein